MVGYWVSQGALVFLVSEAAWCEWAVVWVSAF